MVSPLKTSTLVPIFGDGSGSRKVEQSPVEDKFASSGQPRGEFVHTIYLLTEKLNTLKLSLLHLQDFGDCGKLQGSSMFYFSDNSVTYYIASSGFKGKSPLHNLICNIRFLEIELRIILLVFYIPGIVMITQGTDSLSRGI